MSAVRNFFRKCNQIKSESALVKALEEKIKNQANTLRGFEQSNRKLKRNQKSDQQKLGELEKELEETRKALQDVLDGDEMRSCKICNEPYNDAERETVKLECPHIFCKKCAIQFQRTCYSLCPFCRKFFGQFYPVKL